MKKHVVLFISALVFGLSFTSCNSDDDSSVPSALGKWNLEKFEYYDSMGNLLDTEEVEYDCETNKVFYFDFKSNGEFDIVSYKSTCSEDKYIGEWELQGQKVVFTIDSGEFESIELTNSTLVFKTLNSSGFSTLLYLKR